MNIIIDARAVTNNRTGVGNYTVHLAESLSSIDTKNRYLVLKAYFRHKIKALPLLSGLLRIIIYVYDNFIFPVKLLMSNAGIYHNPAFILPLLNFRYKKIVTIHDLGFYVYGDKFARGWHARHMRLMLPYSLRQADKIIAVSQATKKQIVDIFKISPEKIAVTCEGVSENYKLIQDRNEVEKVLRKYNIQAPYILFVGTMDPRKNLLRLIQAFNKVKNDKNNLKLVIVGNKGELFTEELHKMVASGDIILTGYVEEEDLVYLYNGAIIFAFPSLYEGFGLPILEAMTCGVPVITSNVYSMPEVAGDAALLIDPGNIDEIAAAIRRLRDEPMLRKELVVKGLARAKQFTWVKTAVETLSIYQEVMGQNDSLE